MPQSSLIDPLMIKTSSEVRALFLDLGGVLLTNSWDRDCRRRAAERFQLDLDDLNERHHQTFNTYEEGKIDLDCYLDRVVFNEARKFSRQEFKQFIFAQSQPYPQAIKLMKDIKQTHNLLVAAVSNDARELVAYRVATFALKSLVDIFVCSCFVHCRKPDEDIFRLALDVAQVLPTQVIYVDDRRLFVEVANKLGIHGIHHLGLESTRAALAELGLDAKTLA